jgi:hypothetical protein
MNYSMYRADGCGDSGGMSIAFWYDSEGNIQSENDAKPRVGVCMRVGSRFARTMASQDWWQCGWIQEIIESSDNYVKFRTYNSVYEWRCG